MNHEENGFGLKGRVTAVKICRSVADDGEFLERGGTESGCDGDAGGRDYLVGWV